MYEIVIQDALVALVGLLLSVGLYYVRYFVLQYIGIQLDQKHSTALLKAINAEAMRAVLTYMDEHDTTLKTHSDILAAVTQYALDQVPDAVEHFRKGNPQWSLERLVETRTKPSILESVVISGS